MGCNGNNHRPGCDCGWGGVFYGLGLTSGISYWGRNESYSNPNARCPRCNALVFFYRSPDGGSVYFDDLGPPWPKHPCMDVAERSLSPKRARHGLATPSWMSGGWHPLPCDGIEIFKDDVRLIAISVSMGDDRMFLFARKQSAEIKAHSPMLWRRKDGTRGHYEISTIDHAGHGFREVRFDAFRNADEIVGIVRAAVVIKGEQLFVKRLYDFKIGLLHGIAISGLAAKMDAIIERFRQRLMDGGDLEALESLAQTSMRTLLAGEINRMEKVDRASALHEALISEGRRLMVEFAEYEARVKPALKDARLYAIHALLPLDVAVDLLRTSALGAISANKDELKINSSFRLLDSFIDELMQSSALGGKNAKIKIKKAAIADLRKNFDIESVKRNISDMVRAYTEAAESEAQVLKDRQKTNRERLIIISALLDEAAKKHPMIERSFLESSLAKKSNSGTPIENIQKTLEAVVNKWVKVNAREFQTGVVKRGAAHSKDGSKVVGDREVGPGARLTRVGRSSAASHSKPFNTALADKLALALVKKE